MANLKTTGFGRFFIFLFIAAPLIYSGVAIYNGQNPLDAAKRDLGISTSTAVEQEDDSRSSETTNLKSKLFDLKEELQEKNDEIRSLKKDLKACEASIPN